MLIKILLPIGMVIVVLIFLFVFYLIWKKVFDYLITLGKKSSHPKS